MEAAIGAERRWFPRFPFHSRAVMTIDGVQQEGALIDLSLSGVLFRGRAAIVARTGEGCILDIMQGAGRGVVRASARVAYAEGELAGLQFKQLDFGTMQGLMRIAEMNLGTPELMKRELGALLKAPAGRLFKR